MREGLDQDRQALDRGEAADVDEHRAARGGADGPLPEGVAIDGAGGEDGVEAVREDGEALERDVEQPRRPLGALRGADDQPLAFARPALEALRPAPRRGGRAAAESASISSSISSSVPWMWPMIGTPGRARAAASFSGVR